MGSEPPPSSPATITMSALLLEATGDSESDYPEAEEEEDHGGWPVDAESWCGGEDGGPATDCVEALSWDRWMRECATYQQQVDGDDGECAASASEDAATATTAAAGAESADRLFWEECIAHGF